MANQPIKMMQQELDEHMKLHLKWLNSARQEGKPFTASNLDFAGLNFENVNLSGGNLVRCDFTNCRMRKVDMGSINLSESIFNGADLSNANLSHCDVRYIEFDMYTNFFNANTAEMMIDAYNFALLPETVDKKNIQVFDKNSIFLEFQFQEEEEKFVAEELIKTFDQYILQKYSLQKNINSELKQKHGKFIYIVHTQTETDKLEVEHEKINFGKMLRHDIDVAALTSDRTAQMAIRWRINRLVNDYEIMKELADQRKLELAAAQNQLVILREDKNKLERVNNILMDVAEQLKSNAPKRLSPPKIYLRAQMSQDGNDIKLIDSSEVMFIEKKADDDVNTYFPEMMLIDEDKPTPIYNKLSDVEEQLLRNPNFIIGNKGLIINVKQVSKYHNDKNNVIACFVRDNKETIRKTVSQTRKDKFGKLHEAMKQEPL